MVAKKKGSKRKSLKLKYHIKKKCKDSRRKQRKILRMQGGKQKGKFF